MMDLHVALGACLVLGTALQFVILPIMHFHHGVNPDRYRLDEEIVVSTHSINVGSSTGNDVKVSMRNGPPTLTPLKECPEINIPNLNTKNFLDLDEWSMDQAESQILGPEALERVRQATAQVNSVIPNLIDKNHWFKTSGRRRMETNLSQLKMDIGNYTVTPGGHWKPRHCVPKWKVALIIPFRNRSYHLPIFLRYIVPMLQRQQLEFGIFIINQENDLSFNRAMLMNIGFLESMNLSRWDCFIFHDVDHVPMSDLNYYGCKKMPRHFLTGDSIWNYTLVYDTLFGGVTGFLESDLRKMNGFPNVYWGWGGEDDEIYLRVQKAGLKVAPRPKARRRFIGFYKVIEHHHNSAPELAERFKMLKNSSSRMDYDGLNNLRYPPPRLEFHPLYLNISVDIFKLRLPGDREPNTKAGETTDIEDGGSKRFVDRIQFN